jgi:hypothetical protein
MRTCRVSPATLATVFAAFGLISVADAGEAATAPADDPDAVIRECLSEYRAAVDEGKTWKELFGVARRLAARLEAALSDVDQSSFDKAKHTEVVLLFLMSLRKEETPTLWGLWLQSGICRHPPGLVSSLVWEAAEYWDFDLARIRDEYERYYRPYAFHPVELLEDLDGDGEVEILIVLQSLFNGGGAFMIVDMTPEGLASVQYKPEGLPDSIDFAFDEEAGEIVQSFQSHRRFGGRRLEGEKWSPFYEEHRLEARLRYVDGEVTRTKAVWDLRTYAEPAPPEPGGG